MSWVEAGGASAEQGSEGESGNAGQQHSAASEVAGQPPGHGQDDGVGDQVGGDYPGSFFVGGAEISGDVGDGDIDDRGVQDFHECGEHHGDGHNPRIHRRAGLCWSWRLPENMADYRCPGRGSVMQNTTVWYKYSTVGNQATRLRVT